MSGDSEFLSRWSRRKREARAEAEPELPAEAPEPEPEDAVDLDAMSDEELLAHFDLPDPDTLAPEADFSAFMARAVPDRLRRRALRVLWRSNPVFDMQDGMNEYCEDFTAAAVLTGPVRTAYQVGRGMKAHLDYLAEQAERAAAAAEEAPQGGEDGDTEPLEPPEPAEETLAEQPAEPADPAPVPVAERDPDGPAPGPEPPRRRRMVFRRVEDSEG